MSYYLMHRGWMDNPVFRNEKFTDREAWQWLIQEASFEPHKIRYGNKMIEVIRGQIPTSYRNLKDKFQWSNDRVRHFLILLQSESMVTLETGTGFLIITICNYDKYQTNSKILTKSGTPNGTVVGTPSGTPNGTNINNINKYKQPNKEEAQEFLLPEWINPETWNSFMEVRKTLKAANTLRAMKSIIKKLEEFKKIGNDPNAIIETSVRSSWKDVYLPKNNGGSDGRPKTQIERAIEATERARLAREQRSAETVG